MDSSATKINANLLDTTLRALKETSPLMEHFLFQAGTKVTFPKVHLEFTKPSPILQYYGPQLAGITFLQPGPHKEDEPRIAEPVASDNDIFYYKQLEVSPLELWHHLSIVTRRT
jgi:hypothetical protein